MQVKDYRIRLAKWIIVSNIGLLALATIFYFMGGFTGEELTEVLKSLGPVKVLYTSAAVRFLMNMRAARRRRVTQLEPAYRVVASALIYFHITALYLVVIFYALGAGDADSLGISLAAVEAAFDVIIGIVISNMFSKVPQAA